MPMSQSYRIANQIQQEEKNMDENVKEKGTATATVEQEQEKQELLIDKSMYISLQVMMYDKKISEAESVAAHLKHEKANFLYNQQLVQAKRLDKESRFKQQFEKEI